ncbi:hypothetical protein EVAR_8686_1 [Eumeta japonica]|uniref:Uncharacterized protein n=1 Tax=Eumeta variegata TaxID=151549 RepID=A0A4C1TUY6_EUMVA|nr:hypothetical protein EVAR_8686_1 [Eumeta japonica]
MRHACASIAFYRNTGRCTTATSRPAANGGRISLTHLRAPLKLERACARRQSRRVAVSSAFVLPTGSFLALTSEADLSAAPSTPPPPPQPPSEY